MVDQLPEAIIDPNGKYKYIQILVTHKETGESKLFVRGYKSCPYHMIIMEKFQNEELNQIENSNLYIAECPGGGRIEHNPDSKKLFIYGYSQSYGQPEHAKAQAILQRAYPDYEVTWSNEGY